MPKVNWLDLTYPPDSVNDVILNCFIKAAFNQVVDFPTRNDAILDLIFTNDTLLFSKYRVMHHLAIVIIIAFHVHLFVMCGHRI